MCPKPLNRNAGNPAFTKAVNNFYFRLLRADHVDYQFYHSGHSISIVASGLLVQS